MACAKAASPTGPDEAAAGTCPPLNSTTAKNMCATERATLAHLLALCGNGLLEPLGRTGAYGLDASFWRELPVGRPNETVDEALRELAAFADSACAGHPVDKAVERVDTEFARLFIGPPRPAVPPWQTMYEGQATHVGMGRPAFEMKQQLHLAQLELRQANAQYEDHLGIELLLAAVLVEREGGAKGGGIAQSFAHRFPLSWAGKLEQRVRRVSPCGYYAPFVKLARGALEMI